MCIFQIKHLENRIVGGLVLAFDNRIVQTCTIMCYSYQKDTNRYWRIQNGRYKTIEATPAKDLPVCPVETTLTLISNKWKVLILRDLMPGTKRFGELKKSIGHVTQKVLTAQLRQMEESGLLTRFE